MVLDRVECVECRHLLRLALQPTGDRGDHVLLAVLEHLELGAAVEEAALFLVVLPGIEDRLDDRLRRSAFQHPLAGEVSGEPHPVHGAHALDVVGVGGEQFLGDELDQHVVVALEGSEHVGVGLQRDQPVLGEIACAAAGFARLLDGPGCVPGVGGLQARGPRLQLPLLLGVGVVGRLQIVVFATNSFCANCSA